MTALEALEACQQGQKKTAGLLQAVEGGAAFVVVIPAKAGIRSDASDTWIPAFAGMTALEALEACRQDKRKRPGFSELLREARFLLSSSPRRRGSSRERVTHDSGVMRRTHGFPPSRE